jgi:hypothetical protein
MSQIRAFFENKRIIDLKQWLTQQSKLWGGGWCNLVFLNFAKYLVVEESMQSMR